MRDPKDYIIFPLDVPSRKEAEHFIKLLSGHIGMFKVGLELFIQSGPDIVEMIHGSGDTGVFLDLKLHDIPVTVSRAVARVAELGVRFATVAAGITQRYKKMRNILLIIILPSSSTRNTFHPARRGTGRPHDWHTIPAAAETFNKKKGAACHGPF